MIASALTVDALTVELPVLTNPASKYPSTDAYQFDMFHIFLQASMINTRGFPLDIFTILHHSSSLSLHYVYPSPPTSTS